ncbi:MAG: SemiSWEET family transporter [Candidatus Altiarchaeota archaeon]
MDSEKLLHSFERIIIYLAVVSPLANIPQLLRIWVGKNASGVSALSWTLFALLSLIWLAYGILKKDRPIAVMFLLLVILQSSIALGAFIYQ